MEQHLLNNINMKSPLENSALYVKEKGGTVIGITGS